MSYFVTAWRDKSGNAGISVHTKHPYGWENAANEEILIGDEVEGFLARCREAWERARGFTEAASEEAPGPYDDGWL